MSKKQMSHKAVLIVSDWVKSNAEYVKNARSVHDVSIRASEDLKFPVSPSSIRSMMDIHGIVRPKREKEINSIAGQLDRAEFDQLKRDVAFIAASLSVWADQSGRFVVGKKMNEISERNK